MSYTLKHFVVCISGFSGSGKDEFAKVFVEEESAPKVGLADPAKRHMADLYGFDELQLFGPSSARNMGDLRYPKPVFFEAGLTISSIDPANPPKGLKGELKAGQQYWEFRPRKTNTWGNPLGAASDLPFLSRRVKESIAYVPEGHPMFWLSPRESLQLYCELMNTMYGDTWIRKSLNTHVCLGQTTEVRGHRFMKYSYNRMYGLMTPGSVEMVPAPENGGAFFSCSADFRHRHEFNLVKKFISGDFIPVMVRVKRPSVPTPPYDHRSETEQATIPDSFFDFVVENDKTVEDLHARAREIILTVQEPGWKPSKEKL